MKGFYLLLSSIALRIILCLSLDMFTTLKCVLFYTFDLLDEFWPFFPYLIFVMNANFVTLVECRLVPLLG